MKILVTGDRQWDDYDLMRRVLWEYAPPTYLGYDVTLIHGDAKGADQMAAKIAFLFGWQVRKYPAQWHKYHRTAGPIRNRQMLDIEQPDLVIAFHKHWERSKGTKDMVAYAEKRGVLVRFVPERN